MADYSLIAFIEERLKSSSLRRGLLAIITCFIISAGSFLSLAQNPYLPMWEYIPDGEPYVFEDPDQPGQYRVYIYGSHDSSGKEYCGREHVLWSAPIDDLNNWRYDGIIFKSVLDRDGNNLNADGRGDLLYAPDVVEVKDKDGNRIYYLYPNNISKGRGGMVAKSDRPDGPFEVINWSDSDPKRAVGLLKFDPAVFVDDDGRVYGYWGFKQSLGAELDPATMTSLKPGTEIVESMIPGRDEDNLFKFFEASSMRKIKDKYVFIYSRYTRDGEFGLPTSNYNLAYAYSDNPLGPFTYGGTIIDVRGRDKDEEGRVIVTGYPSGNTHGSICEINGQWWVFYHRHTGTNEYSRQLMVAPIEVNVEEGPGGEVSISEAEVTSEGFMTSGLNPLYKTPAGLACYLVGPQSSTRIYPNFNFHGSYIQATRFDPESFQGPYNQKIPFCPVVNNTAGSTVGYKYFDFSVFKDKEDVEFETHIVPEGIAGRVTLVVGNPYISKGGKVIGSFDITSEMPGKLTEIRIPVKNIKDISGKQPLYFIFDSDVKGKSICELHDFRFIEK